MNSGNLLRIEDMTIEALVASEFRIIASRINLSLDSGETIGIVGESGSGKSMTARAIIGLLPAGLRATGRVDYAGRNLLDASERTLRRYRGSEIGMVFQDPFTTLSPVRRCGRHITEQLRDQNGGKLRRRERRDEAVRRLAEVGIHNPGVADRFPFELSGGMRQRVGIAAALARDPKILIADEPSTALDVTTQSEILRLLKSLQVARGMGLIMITHDLRVAFSMCDRIYVLYAGQIVEVGPSAAVESEPRHPYTLGLILSEPPLDQRLAALTPIPGSVPAAHTVRDSCAFASRCEWVAPPCHSPMDLRRISHARFTACCRTNEIREAMLEKRQSQQVLAPYSLNAGPVDALLRVADVRKIFKPGLREETIAVDGVSLEVGVNESVGLVGESGSGKTTLGRCIVGLEAVSAGTIVIAGIEATNRNLSHADRRRLRRVVQFVFQDPYSSLNPARTVGFTLAEAILTNEPRKRGVDKAVEDLLAQVELPRDYRLRKPIALSGGERQRVAIARTLAVKPTLLICDEPVSSLDVSVQAQILNLFASLREELGMSYLFISHDLAVIRQVAERAYVMNSGAIVEAGLVQQIFSAPKHAYTTQLIQAVPGNKHSVAGGVAARAGR
jgi:oligopeptide/dipeptide ABC transporter ATP-binding protein